MLEIPTYSMMVPFWRMLTAKRVGLQRRSVTTAQTRGERLNRYLDYLRPRYPLKFDFCRMTLEEMTSMMQAAIRDDARTPEIYRPLVAIGHTKDLEDFETIERFLAFLHKRGIPIVTFDSVRKKCSMELSIGE